MQRFSLSPLRNFRPDREVRSRRSLRRERRNIIVIFMSVELMLSAANLNFITFARYWQTQGGEFAYNGHIMTIFVIVVAAAEAAIGLGLLLALYRNRETVGDSAFPKS